MGAGIAADPHCTVAFDPLPDVRRLAWRSRPNRKRFFLLRRNKPLRKTKLLIPCPHLGRTASSGAGQGRLTAASPSISGAPSSLDSLPGTQASGPIPELRRSAVLRSLASGRTSGSKPFSRTHLDAPDHSKSLISQSFLVVSMIEWCHAFRVAPRAIRRRSAMRAVKIVDGCG